MSGGGVSAAYPSRYGCQGFRQHTGAHARRDRIDYFLPAGHVQVSLADVHDRDGGTTATA